MSAEPGIRALEFELPRRVARKIGQFAGRSWLLPRLTSWWQGEDRFFVLKGGPGAGKSMISGWLAGHGPIPGVEAQRQQLQALRRAVAVVHYCQADTFSVGPRAFVTAAAKQMLERIPEFEKALLATRSQMSVNVTIQAHSITGGEVIGLRNVTFGEAPDSVTFTEGFVKPLIKLYEGGFSRPLLILIDGLDEEVIYDGQTGLAQLLSRTGELPPQVRFLLTSRDEERVLQHFDVRALDLITDAPDDVDDVRDFAVAYLSRKTADAALAAKAADRVATAAQGVFLYAVRVLEDFADELLGADGPDAPSLPEGLPGVYRDFLRRELGVEDKGKRWHRVYKPLLGCLAVAQGAGLTAKMLEEVVGPEVEEALETCRQYLVGAKGTGPFRVFHKSFSDFLLGGDPGDRYYIDGREIHSRIAAAMLKKHSPDWSGADDYTRQALAAHVAEGRRLEQYPPLLTREWMRARSPDSRLQDFSADVERLWSSTRDAATDGQSFALGFRCALILGSVHSNARHYPLALLVRAFDLGLVSAARLFSMQSGMADSEHVQLSAALIAHGKLTRPQRMEAVSSAMATIPFIGEPIYRLRAYALMARVAPDIGEKARSLALKIARDTDVLGTRLLAFKEIAEAAPGHERKLLIDECLDAVSAADPEAAGLGSQLSDLAPLVDASQAEKFWEIARLQGPSYRLETGLALLSVAQSPFRQQLAEQLLEHLMTGLRSVGGEPRSTESLTRSLALVVPYLDDERISGLRSSIRQDCPVLPAPLNAMIDSRLSRAVTLAEAIASSREFAQITDPEVRTRARIRLAKACDAAHDALFDEFMRDAIEPMAKIELLREWLPLPSGPAGNACVSAVLSFSAGIIDTAAAGNRGSRMLVYVLSQVARSMTADQAKVMLADICPRLATVDHLDLANHVAHLLDPAQLAKLFPLCSGSGDEPEQFAAWAAFASRLTGGSRDRALEKAARILPQLSGSARILAVAALSPQLPAAQSNALLVDTAAALPDLQGPGLVSALRKLASLFDPVQAEVALDAVRKAEARGDFLDLEPCLAVLAPRLTPVRSREIQDELLARSGDPSNYGVTLPPIVDLLDADRLGDIAQRMVARNPDDAKVLLSLAPRMAREWQTAIIDAVRPIVLSPEGPPKLILTTMLAGLLEQPERGRIIDSVIARLPELDSHYQRQVLLRLQPLVDAASFKAQLDGYLARMQSREDVRWTMVVRELSPFMDLDQLRELLARLPAQAGEMRAEAHVAFAVRLVELDASDAGKFSLNTLAGLLYSLRDADRACILAFTAGLLRANAPLEPSVLETLFAGLEEILEQWRFDALALSPGVSHVH